MNSKKNSMDEQSINSGLNNYHVILFPDAEKEWDPETLSDYADGIFPEADFKYLIGWEQSKKTGKWHWHATFVNMQMSVETLRAKLKKKFNPSKKGLAIKQCRDLKQSLIYTVKDGHYWASGFTEAEVEEYYSQSYEKTAEKVDFKKLLKKIEQDYLEDHGSFQEEEFVERYIQAYLDYGKPIYLSHIKARLITVRLRKSPERLKNYVRDMLMDIGSGDYYQK